jgi:hypothetical protein
MWYKLAQKYAQTDNFTLNLTELREKYLDNMSQKGWFPEYGGKISHDRPKPYDINCGDCRPFGMNIEHKIPGAQQVWSSDMPDYQGPQFDDNDNERSDYDPDDPSADHTFIKYNGKYYDAECVDGVCNWRELPIYINNRKNRLPNKLASKNQGTLPVGNCINSFDEDGNCLTGMFNDVSDFAVVEENSKPISRLEFQKLTGSNAPHREYLYHSGRGIVMGYDPKTDVHHFYEILPQFKRLAQNNYNPICYHGTSKRLWSQEYGNLSTLYFTINKEDAENYAYEAGVSDQMNGFRPEPILISVQLSDLKKMKMKLESDDGWKEQPLDTTYQQSIDGVGSFTATGNIDKHKHNWDKEILPVHEEEEF